MKKSFLLFIPSVLLLASCETFNVGYTDARHEAGVDNSVAPGYVEPSYPAYPGDQFTVSDDTQSAVLTFTGYKDGESNIQDIEKLNSFVTTETKDFFVSMENPLNVGIDKEDGLFIGSWSSYVDGYVTLAFSKEIKNIEIIATPYYSITYPYNEEKFTIDEETGISVNDSPYIMLSTTRNEDGSVKESACRYLNYARENKDKITIKVGRRRAFIKKITLYY